MQNKLQFPTSVYCKHVVLFLSSVTCLEGEPAEHSGPCFSSLHCSPDLLLWQKSQSISWRRTFTSSFPPGDLCSQGLVLSKLCQPCNDLQLGTVSLLIRRPSSEHPPSIFDIPPWPNSSSSLLPLFLPPSRPIRPVILPSVRPSPRGSCSPSTQPAAVSFSGDSLSGASRHPSPEPDWRVNLRDYQLLSVNVCPP